MTSDTDNAAKPIAFSGKHARLGPWALVTGASDGIGAATARALAAKGFDLIVVARREARLEALASDLRRLRGTRVEVIAQDLGAEQGVTELRAALTDRAIPLAEIGVAVLAAGYGTSGRLAEADPDEEHDMLRVNCTAVLELSQVFARAMTTRRAGQIVLFGSIVGFQGNAMTAHYSATKAYVQTLAEGLAAELRPVGVNVLSVAPGPIASGFADRARMTMGQAGSPDVVARAIVDALGRSGTIRPGFLSKLLGYSMAMTPRPLRVRIMSQIMKGMTKPPTNVQRISSQDA